MNRTPVSLSRSALLGALGLACVLALSGCGAVGKSLGLDKQPPDEFNVVTRAPLELPPSYDSLPEPSPGMQRPQELKPQDQAMAVLLGGAVATTPSASMGEDMLLAVEEADRKRFDRAMDSVALAGIGFDIRLHLHPDVDATVDLGGAAISMALKSGEIWVFRHDGTFDLALEPSVYLETGRLKPRATRQIVLSGRALNHATRVRWSLAKAHETAVAVRDLSRDEPAFES